MTFFGFRTFAVDARPALHTAPRTPSSPPCLSQGGRRVEIDKKNPKAGWAREGYVSVLGKC
jgi:hypothetical protein